MPKYLNSIWNCLTGFNGFKWLWAENLYGFTYTDVKDEDGEFFYISNYWLSLLLVFLFKPYPIIIFQIELVFKLYVLRVASKVFFFNGIFVCLYGKCNVKLNIKLDISTPSLTHTHIHTYHFHCHFITIEYRSAGVFVCVCVLISSSNLTIFSGILFTISHSLRRRYCCFE